MLDKITQGRTLNLIVGLLLVIGIGFYVFRFSNQIKSVRRVCDTFPVGSDISDFQEIVRDLPIKSGGPLESDDNRQFYYACSPYSLCEISCDIKVKNNIVVEAKSGHGST